VLPPRLAGRRHSRRNGVCGWQQRDSRRATKLLVFTCLVGTVCWWNVASRPLPPPSEAAAFGDVLATAARRALGGGLSGAAAGVIQVLTLMWLRTGMHYQYRHGVSTRHALRTLYSAGGIPRLYQGLPFALMQSPLVRFGDTAAQSGMLSLLASSRLTLSERTACASAVASCWRLAVTPLDCVKTTLQVEGSAGWAQLRQKVRARGIGVLYDGALANMAASFLGGLPWWLTFNALSAALPVDEASPIAAQLAQRAVIGFLSTAVSDCLTNGLRVLKTSRQTSPTSLSYSAAAAAVLAKDGVAGLLGRGLRTRLLINGLQSALFVVVWKLIEQRLDATWLSRGGGG